MSPHSAGSVCTVTTRSDPSLSNGSVKKRALSDALEAPAPEPAAVLVPDCMDKRYAASASGLAGSATRTSRADAEEPAAPWQGGSKR